MLTADVINRQQTRPLSQWVSKRQTTDSLLLLAMSSLLASTVDWLELHTANTTQTRLVKQLLHEFHRLASGRPDLTQSDPEWWPWKKRPIQQKLNSSSNSGTSEHLHKHIHMYVVCMYVCTYIHIHIFSSHFFSVVNAVRRYVMFWGTETVQVTLLRRTLASSP